MRKSVLEAHQRIARPDPIEIALSGPHRLGVTVGGIEFDAVGVEIAVE